MVLVIIDGLDASGKTTQAELLRRRLERAKQLVLLRAHPASDNVFGAQARRFLYARGRSAHFCAALFYMLDVLRSVMLYSWRRVDYIIFVRYLVGTAYLPAPLHRLAFGFFTWVVPTSELMFFLDVTPREAVRRIGKARRRREMFESFTELQRVRCKALRLASTAGWHIVDANRPAEIVEQTIHARLRMT